jgi:CTP:molybdopterin cytidylyltransferase MocA
MGRPKLLLPWAGTTVLGHLLRLWRGVGADEIAVVCARGDAPITAEIARDGGAVHSLENPAPDEGMFSSVQGAARWEGWAATTTHWALALGDQPQVSDGTLRHLLDFARARPGEICQPARHGRPRHPVILPAAFFRALAAWTGPTLKDFLQQHPRALCEMDDPGLDLDLDTPADYERALRGGP